jgi:hypothetical protein
VFAPPQIPQEQREGSPSGIRIPMAQLGYMGRFNDDRLKGIGGALLYDAARRVAAAGQHTAIWGIWLEPENEALESWYADWGFQYTVPDPKRPRQPGQRARMFCGVQHLLDSLRQKGAPHAL